MAQQTGATLKAAGASTLPLGVAGAGVIQRMKIGEFDTDVPDQLDTLKTKISGMRTLSDVKAMQSGIIQQLGSEKPDENVKKVLQRLDIVEKRLTSKQPTAPAEQGKSETKEPSPEEKSGQFAAIQAKGEELKDRAKVLDDTRSPARPDIWLADYRQLNFEALAAEWEALTAGTNPAYDLNTRRFVRGVRDAISAVNTIKERHEATEQKGRETEADANRLTANLGARKQDVTNQRQTIGEYLDLRILAPEANELLVEWLFGTAMNRLIGHGDPLATGLLKHLKTLRTANQQQGGPGGPSVYLDVEDEQYGVRGLAELNKVNLTIGLHRMGRKPRDLLASDAEKQTQTREELVNEVAGGFIHETAHMWQLRKYQNVSHPWTAKHVDTKQLPPGWLGDQIPMSNAPADVQSAYRELEGGGVDGKAKDDDEWRRAFTAMTSTEYYAPGKRDMRARELVSHLMEIVYQWNSPDRFRRVFPRCSELLDRVIAKGADVS